MAVSQAEALSIVSVALMKTELRIPATETEHDALLTGQIHSAANYVMKSTGADLAGLPRLRPAIVSAVRSQYDGNRELSPDSATYAWMEPYRARAPYKEPE